ncbi:MAG: tetratricopeptide repeat protein, partial [Janthinobacterium lividum]
RFEVFCYYNHYTDDDASRRIAALADHWLPCRAWSDDVMAARIRSDAIDILVDLSGHTAHNRLLVFARKPAPVQMTWIGYQSTTGLESMDYRLTDFAMDPPGATDLFHSETILRIVSSASFKPSVYRLPVNRLPALSSGTFTYACLNQLTKITPQAIGVWSNILRTLPHSRMMLGNVNDAATRQRLLEKFAAHGIDETRLVLHSRMSLAEYLALHHDIDLCLDSFPYNGGTTTLHAISMGVPTVTMEGVTPVARAGWAINAGAGLFEFVVKDQEHYIAKALAAASDLPALDALRQVLPARIQPAEESEDNATLRYFQEVVREIWTGWCKRGTAH